MTHALSELLALLQLERVDEDRFRGASQDLGWGAVFGGQVLGQALSAAGQTVSPDRWVHSVQGYFLQRGDASRPIDYVVERLREGRSFTTRRVIGLQQGRPIFHLSAGFQLAEVGFDHQDAMPAAPDPADLTSERELAKALADVRPLDSQSVQWRNDPLNSGPSIRGIRFIRRSDRHRQAWFRANGRLSDDLHVHQQLLAWASDSHPDDRDAAS